MRLVREKRLGKNSQLLVNQIHLPHPFRKMKRVQTDWPSSCEPLKQEQNISLRVLPVPLAF